MIKALIGIDPGLVHTGAVAFLIDTVADTCDIEYEVIAGADTETKVPEFVKKYSKHKPEVFIEQYLDRGTVFTQHGRMRDLERSLKMSIPKARLINNTGVKKIITPSLLKVFNANQLPTTHHQDLESAARIALYGSLKDDELNKLLYKVVVAITNRKENT